MHHNLKGQANPEADFHAQLAVVLETTDLENNYYESDNEQRYTNQEQPSGSTGVAGQCITRYLCHHMANPEADMDIDVDNIDDGSEPAVE